MSTVRLEQLQCEYGSARVVDGVSIDVQNGEFVALLGPSGSGKTTILRAIAGFVTPKNGRVLINSQDVTNVPPYARGTAMVFQGYALFPHLTIAQNVGFGLEMRKVARATRARQIAEALRTVRLDGLGARFPHQLSGGQQQRVALARALVVNPHVLLLDEPLSNLDAKLRVEVRMEIRELQKRLGLTTILVTHDQDEAMTMADRMVVIDAGRVRQIGTPTELYEHPRDVFVARFLGRCNVLEGIVRQPGQLLVGNIPVPCGASRPGQRAALLVRPERVELTPRRTDSPASGISGRLSAISYLGGQMDWHVDTEAGPILVSRSTPAQGTALRYLSVGDPVQVTWPADFSQLIDHNASQGGLS